jgi:predicted small secreted protein
MADKKFLSFVYVLTHHTTVGILVGLALLFVLSLGGCNTVKGAAKDIYSATEALQASFSDTNTPEDSVQAHAWD